MKAILSLAAMLCALAPATPARAQAEEQTPPRAQPDDESGPVEPATDETGASTGHEVLVIEGKAPIDAVSARARVTAEDLRASNTVNVEDALKYLPNLHVRKRYVGDPNGVLQIRGISSWQTARTNVVADGMPLSYHLQTRYSGAPRWALVAPEEVERIEVIYGPYSAAQSGHAMAGTVDIKTRMPEGREGVAQASMFAQRFRHYGSAGDYVGYKAYASAGDRAGDLRYFVAYNHLANEGQPQSWGAISGPFEDATAADTRVTGVYRDQDPRGLDRLVYGHRGTESVQQHLAKLKLSYELSPRLRARSSVVFLDRETARSEGGNYLRDSAGDPVWACPCDHDGRSFSIRPGDFAAGSRRQSDLLAALRVEAEISEDWRLQANGSYYRVFRDQDLSHDRSSADPAYTGSGIVTTYGNTRWGTLDVKLGTDRFVHDSVSFETGYQLASYGLELRQFTSDDVSTGQRDALRNASGGQTELHALYAQARWSHAGVDVTPGVRQELWRTRDGFRDDGAGMTDPGHEDRALWRLSPKLVVGYEPVAGTRLQGAVAMAYRFPIVEELFHNEYSQVTTSLADASLRPERGFHQAISLVQSLGAGSAAVHLFEDDVREVIFNQRDMDTSVSTFLNMDRVRTRGVEGTFSRRGRIRTLPVDLGLSVAVQEATILENQANPQVEGNRFPRVPRLRASANGTLHLTSRWNLSAGARYSSNQYDRMENDDAGSGFGAIDSFFVVDAHSSYRFDELGLALSVGVDNLLDETYFVYHPYPQRMFYTDLRWSY
jgi:iron complex outermembrane recepter protein